MVESHKLDPWPLVEGLRPKSGKLRLNLHGTIFEGKSIGSFKRKTELMIWRINMHAELFFGAKFG